MHTPTDARPGQGRPAFALAHNAHARGAARLDGSAAMAADTNSQPKALGLPVQERLHRVR